jgi:class 3 adenylate cyclase
MDQRIQYATTSDGVAIAHTVTGTGPWLISVPSPPDNHLELEWADPEQRQNVEAMSRFRSVVRFDPRGAGMSEREVSVFDLETRLRDLRAVIEKVGAERFVLLSGGHGNQLSVAYAARHPEQVSQLVAINPFTHGADFMAREQLTLWTHILGTDYRMFTEALGAELYGWGSERGPAYGAYFRECVSAETAFRTYEALIEVDLAPLLPEVRCPVLVIRTRERGMSSEAAARRFAAALPNASMTLVGGHPVEGATSEMRLAIGKFLGEDWTDEPVTPAEPPARPAFEPILRTILFTDLVSHTEMMTRLGDAAGRERLREHERLTREALAKYGGNEVKAMGDGFMASFASVQRALECAIALQRAFADSLLLTPGSDADLRVRVGINAGEPIAEDDDLFGTSVIAAARIAAKAEGGQVLVSDVVRQLVAGKGFLFHDTGEHALKGLEDAIRVWELRWQTA